MAAAKIQRVGSDHPECCQGNTGNGGCEYKRGPNSLYCPLHGGSGSEQTAERADLRQYKLNSIFAGRAKEFSKGSAVKNLADEIALMRTTLEAVFNGIQNTNELMLYCDKIDKLTQGIAKLSETWQKLQERNKELMGRDEIVSLFDQLIEKIIERVTDPDTIALLAEDSRVILERGLSQ